MNIYSYYIQLHIVSELGHLSQANELIPTATWHSLPHTQGSKSAQPPSTEYQSSRLHLCPDHNEAVDRTLKEKGCVEGHECIAGFLSFSYQNRSSTLP